MQRIRLEIEDDLLPPTLREQGLARSWFWPSPAAVTVRDFAREVALQYQLTCQDSVEAIRLVLDRFTLPLEAPIGLLRDGDLINVQSQQQQAALPAAQPKPGPQPLALQPGAIAGENRGGTREGGSGKKRRRGATAAAGAEDVGHIGQAADVDGSGQPDEGPAAAGDVRPACTALRTEDGARLPARGPEVASNGMAGALPAAAAAPVGMGSLTPALATPTPADAATPAAGDGGGAGPSGSGSRRAQAAEGTGGGADADAAAYGLTGKKRSRNARRKANKRMLMRTGVLPYKGSAAAAAAKKCGVAAGGAADAARRPNAGQSGAGAQGGKREGPQQGRTNAGTERKKALALAKPAGGVTPSNFQQMLTAELLAAAMVASPLDPNGILTFSAARLQPQPQHPQGGAAAMAVTAATATSDAAAGGRVPGVAAGAGSQQQEQHQMRRPGKRLQPQQLQQPPQPSAARLGGGSGSSSEEEGLAEEGEGGQEEEEESGSKDDSSSGSDSEGEQREDGRQPAPRLALQHQQAPAENGEGSTTTSQSSSESSSSSSSGSEEEENDGKSEQAHPAPRVDGRNAEAESTSEDSSGSSSSSSSSSSEDEGSSSSSDSSTTSSTTTTSTSSEDGSEEGATQPLQPPQRQAAPPPAAPEARAATGRACSNPPGGQPAAALQGAHGRTQTAAPPQTPDYDGLPRVQGPVSVGDVLAYKLLEIGVDLCPRISIWRQCRVVALNQQSGDLVLEPHPDPRVHPLEVELDILRARLAAEAAQHDADGEDGGQGQGRRAEGYASAAAAAAVQLDWNSLPFPTDYSESGVLEMSLDRLADVRAVRCRAQPSGPIQSAATAGPSGAAVGASQQAGRGSARKRVREASGGITGSDGAGTSQQAQGAQDLRAPRSNGAWSPRNLGPPRPPPAGAALRTPLMPAPGPAPASRPVIRAKATAAAAATITPSASPSGAPAPGGTGRPGSGPCAPSPRPAPGAVVPAVGGWADIAEQLRRRRQELASPGSTLAAAGPGKDGAGWASRAGTREAVMGADGGFPPVPEVTVPGFTDARGRGKGREGSTGTGGTGVGCMARGDTGDAGEPSQDGAKHGQAGGGGAGQSAGLGAEGAGHGRGAVRPRGGARRIALGPMLAYLRSSGDL